MRGLGKLQNWQISLTNYRIIGELYVQPYGYEELQRVTRIHRNTLKLRLNNLVSDKLVLRSEYTFRHKNIFRSHYFYMLNWAKQDAKKVVDYLFENIYNDSLTSLWYEINCLEIDVYKKSMLLGGRHRWTSSSDFNTKIRDFRISENDLWLQIIDLYKYGYLSNEAAEKRSNLIRERDILFEHLVYESTKFCIDRFFKMSPFNMLIFFKFAGLYCTSRPYTKFWDIMERLGY